MGQSTCCLYNIRRYRSDGTTYWYRDYAGHKGARLLNYQNNSESLVADSILPSGARSAGNLICIDSNEDYVAVGGQWISGADGDPEWYNIAVYNYDGSLRWRRGLDSIPYRDINIVPFAGKFGVTTICIDNENNIWASGSLVDNNQTPTFFTMKFDINGNVLKVISWIKMTQIKRRIGGGIWFNGTIPDSIYLGANGPYLNYADVGLDYYIVSPTTGVFSIDSNGLLGGIKYVGSDGNNYILPPFTFDGFREPGDPRTTPITNFCDNGNNELSFISDTMMTGANIFSVLQTPCVAKSENGDYSVDTPTSSNPLDLTSRIKWGISPKDHWYSYGLQTSEPGTIPHTIPEYNHDYDLWGVNTLHNINSISIDPSTGMWICGRYWDENRQTIRLAKVNESTGDMILELPMNDEFFNDTFPNYGQFASLICLSDSHLVVRDYFGSYTTRNNNFSKINTSGEFEYRHRHLIYSSFIGHSSTLDGGHVVGSSFAYRIGAGEASFIE